METAHPENGRPIFVLRLSSDPAKFMAFYMDRIWNGGWFRYTPTTDQLASLPHRVQ
jgi:hypothetical protein